MKKKGFTLCSMWLLLSVTVLLPLFCTVPVSASVISVPGDYDTIQEAIDAAGKNDIIQVSAGVYYENLYINQEIELIGADKTTTIIDGQQMGDVIYVDNDAVTITGFTIRNGDNGIRVAGNIGSINITDNIIEDNRYGVSLIGNGQDPTNDNNIVGNTFNNNSNVSVSITTGFSNTIFQNDISDSAFALKLLSVNTSTISDNLLTDNSYGVYISYSGSTDFIDNTVIDNSFGIVAAYSDNILIQDNQVSGSAWAIQLYDSHSCTILHNTVSDNPTYGVYLQHSDSNSVTNNTMSINDWGLVLLNSSLNTFEGNTISANTFGITAVESPNNIIFHNNLISNVDQYTRDFPSTNTFSQGGEGNYWSTYTGLDLDHDGIGDTFVPHYGEDWYPLMRQYGLIPGDVDGDGYVGSADFSVLAGAYGSSSGQPAYVREADFDLDGYIGSADFSILAGNYGKSFP